MAYIIWATRLACSTARTLVAASESARSLRGWSAVDMQSSVTYDLAGLVIMVNAVAVPSVPVEHTPAALPVETACLPRGCCSVRRTPHVIESWSIAREAFQKRSDKDNGSDYGGVRALVYKRDSGRESSLPAVSVIKVPWS